MYIQLILHEGLRNLEGILSVCGLPVQVRHPVMLALLLVTST